MIGIGGPDPGPGLVIARDPGPSLVIGIGGPDPGPDLMIAGGPGLVVAGGLDLVIEGDLGLVIEGDLGLVIEGGHAQPQRPDIVTVVPGVVLIQEVVAVTDTLVQGPILVTVEEGTGGHHRGTGGKAIAPAHVPGIATSRPHFLIVLVTG